MNIVNTFKTLAESLGYRFAYGTRPFLNYEATTKDLTSGEYLFLMLPEDDRQLYNNKAVPSSTQYTIIFQICGKFDTDSSSGKKSELDETFQQKHERRLQTLKELCKSFFQTVVCQNNFEPVSSRAFPEINLYATNVDAYNCEIVFNDAT